MGRDGNGTSVYQGRSLGLARYKVLQEVVLEVPLLRCATAQNNNKKARKRTTILVAVVGEGHVCVVVTAWILQHRLKSPAQPSPAYQHTTMAL